jgi:ribosome-associated translation inhibitor RaiA
VHAVRNGRSFLLHLQGEIEASAAVDDLVDKLDRQVVRHKNRITDHHHSATKRMM